MKSKCSDFRTTSRASQERWSNRSPWWRQAIKGKIIGRLFANRQNCTTLNVLYPFFLKWTFQQKSRQNNFPYKQSLSVCVCFLLIKFWELIRNTEREIMMTAPVFHDWTSKMWMLEGPLITVCLQTIVINNTAPQLLKLLNVVWLLYLHTECEMNSLTVYNSDIHITMSKLSTYPLCQNPVVNYN